MVEYFENMSSVSLILAFLSALFMSFWFGMLFESKTTKEEWNPSFFLIIVAALTLSINVYALITYFFIK